MPFETELMIAAPIIVVAAYIIFGISGFGSALISIPLLAHFLPMKEVVPMMVLVDFSAAFSTGWRTRAQVDRPEAKRFIIPVMVGIVGGVILLKGLPSEPVLLALGVFVVCYGVYALWRRGNVRRVPTWVAYPVGLIGGLVAALFGVAGPIYVTYLSARLSDPSVLRATLSIVFSFSTAARIVLFMITGLLLDTKPWLGALLLLPFMFAGKYIGSHIHLRLPKDQLIRVVNVLLVLSGSSLIAKALGWH